MQMTRTTPGLVAAAAGAVLSLWLWFPPPCLASSPSPTPPHLVMIVADDLGWADVGWRDPDMVTPTLDSLAARGVKLTNAYVQPVCTPTRSALLSGRYPFKIGRQHMPLKNLENASLALDLKLLPQRLRELGYATHMVGKWHLGHCNWSMTPTYRGFDTFYGMYNGQADDYYKHTANGFYDLHLNKDIAWSDKGNYSTELFTDRALHVLESHERSRPLFLMLSYQAVHTPMHAPEPFFSRDCKHISDTNRRMYCAMTAAMDKGIGKVTAALSRLGYDDNLLLFFTSDNGGKLENSASNWPFRGDKGSLWEGGTKAVSFLHSKTLLPDAPYTWSGLAHAVDWFPTLVSVAGGTSAVCEMDGVNLWDSIRLNGPSPRHEIVYNIDEVSQTAAIRQSRYKLHLNPNSQNDWYNPVRGETLPNNVTTFLCGHYHLFDLEADPYEYWDIKRRDRTTHQIVATLKDRLKKLRLQLVPADSGITLPECDAVDNQGALLPGFC